MSVFQRPEHSPFSIPSSDTDDDILAFIEQQAGANYHPSCTCAIGRVVDPELRVYSAEGLRVVDASVMPSVIRGNTNAAVIAIAEKAADILTGNVRREGRTQDRLLVAAPRQMETHKAHLQR